MNPFRIPDEYLPQGLTNRDLEPRDDDRRREIEEEKGDHDLDVQREDEV